MSTDPIPAAFMEPLEPLAHPPTAPPEDGGYITRRILYTAMTVAAVLGGLVGALAIAVSGAGQVSETAAPNPVVFAGARVKPSQELTPQAIYTRDAPGTVYISTLTPSEALSGSGIVINAAGDIITNDHVVAGGTQIDVTFQNNTTVAATIVGTDVTDDLALIHVNGSHLILHPLTFGDSNSVDVGDAVAAIGSPFGLERTLTTGIISATGRTINSPNGFPINGAIQTDAPINPGNSGGPLINAAGAVIGINSQISTETGGSDGIGFAIPSDLIKTKLPELMRGGAIRHAWVGIAGGSVTDLPAAVGVHVKHGVYIEQVIANGPAAKAGLRAGHKTVTTSDGTFEAGGDIIIAIGGHTVNDFADLENATNSSRPGEKLAVTYIRANKVHHTVLTLGIQPTASQPLTLPSG